MRFQGSITRFDNERGFGFVLPDGARTAAFVHVKDVAGNILLRKGERIEFDLITTKRGTQALSVVLLSEDAIARAPHVPSREESR